MTRLAEILDQMSAVLNDLKTVMDQEQQHLSMGQINGSQLQWITEQKSSLLATLDYLEQLRKKEPNTANSVDISQRWQEITVKTQQLRQMNQHNGWLLEGQIERNQQALEMLKPHQEPTLYGANGQTSTTHALLHRPAGKFFNFEAQYRQCSEVRGNPRQHDRH